jgi:hypothetical protein
MGVVPDDRFQSILAAGSAHDSERRRRMAISRRINYSIINQLSKGEGVGRKFRNNGGKKLKGP